MATLSFMKGLAPRRRRTRSVGRVAVITWAIAVAALAGSAASFLLGGHDGAHAIVAEGEGVHAPVVAEAPVEPAHAADPTEFRRTAPPEDGRPRIAIVLRGLGVSTALTAAAVEKLPADITLGLSVYGRNLQKQVDAARAGGHEVFLDIPVEPLGFPNNDAGPKALLTSLSAAENAERLTWDLERATGYAGLVFAPGSPALDNKAMMAPLLGDEAAHGLIWTHARARGLDGAGAAIAAADLVLDTAAGPDEIDAALEQLEALARSKGRAVGLANAYPVSVGRLVAWSAGLEARGIQLVPVSALSVSPAS
ncbi:hypothetical protein sos41_06300 [Alphaproteobacteria bacterium SO-S41]|nr:hypothetical protein sos41_06300 [Alphaproteobacteria bacterium SO-S41]